MTARVFLVDDHEIVRRGIADVIGSAPDLEVVGEAAGVDEALLGYRRSRSTWWFLTCDCPTATAVELCRELKARMPHLNCLMLTSFTDDEALFDAIMAGASGFVLKQVLGSDLLSAIRTVAAGQSLLDAKTTTALLERIRRDHTQKDRLSELTPQEQEVLQGIGEGLTNRQIAARLNLAEKTVKNYVSHVLAKLETTSRTQAAILATKARARRDDYPPGAR